MLQNLETVCLTAIEDRLQQHIEEWAYVCCPQSEKQHLLKLMGQLFQKKHLRPSVRCRFYSVS